MMGDLFEYVSVVPLAKFADMDGPSPVERALGKEQAASFHAQRSGLYYVCSSPRDLSDG